MSAEKQTLTAPEEPAGIAGDTKSAAAAERAGEQAAAPESDSPGTEISEPANDTAAPSGADAPNATPADEPAPDFADEDAALDATNAGIDLGETGDAAAVQDDEAQAAAAGEMAGKSREELVATFANLLEERPVQTLRNEAEAVKIAFYKLHRSATDAARREFVAAGGDEAEFVPEADALEMRLKDLFKEYRRRRDEYNERAEAEKTANLETKLRIIEELKELTGSDETLNTTFARFRELQQRWKETGPVPQDKVKDVWENYNLQTDNFYSIIKINKELRDLDWKKNLTIKTQLCEAAEALVMEPSVVEAFHKLQKMHEEWRETGPVAPEFKEELWHRFQAASSRINKAHQEHFEELKQEQVKNLQLKTELCEKTEELASQEYASRKEWNRASDRLLEIQKVWKTIGFAPKKDNNRIYERFRNACDKFFEAKRTFYAGVRSEMDANLQLKTEICEAAEALRESDDWKRTTDELIALQARWKTIGAVSRRHSDEIWRRFRAACDAFFERKSAHFASQDGEQEENLRRKTALLEEMESADIRTGGYEAIREFQRRWSEIGFVPIRHKEEIQKRYKAAADALFGVLRGSERDRSMSRFKEKVSTMKSSGNRRLRSERERLYGRVKQLEQDIALLENNIGFFSKSKNAESLIAGVKEKIEKSKQEMRDAIEKIRLIDSDEQA